MNMTFKIHQLWKYLRVQDDEILIVRSYNKRARKDEYVIAEATSDGLKISIMSEIPELRSDRPFQMIQQRDSSGHHIIPSVTQLIKDKVSDY